MECFLGASPADREHATTLALFGAAYLWAGLDAQDSRWRVMLAYGAGAWIVGRTLVAVTPAFIREFGTRASWLLIVPGGLVMGLFAPVSYTHLDVYKRQTPSTAPPPTPACWTSRWCPNATTR